MEAVGAASAILGLLGFTAKAILKIYEVYGTYKDAPDTVFRTTRDLRDLSRILEQILDIVNESRGKETTDDNIPTKAGHARVLETLLARDDNLVVACHTEIASLLKLLENTQRLTWPLRKKDVEKHLEAIESLKLQLGLAVQSQSMATLLGIERVIASQTAVLKKHIHDGAGKQALAWIQAPDVWRNLRGAIEKRQPGTGEWLISSTEFQTWLASPQFLWVTGIPGAGKTILSSTVIATLLCQQEPSRNAVVFSYFDFQDASKQQSDTLLKAILAQLATRSSEALECLTGLHDGCSGLRGPSSDELLSVVTTALALFPQTFVVVDAVDKCSDRSMVLKYLRALSELPNLHLIAFSRREADIERAFQSLAQEITLTTKSVDNDIAMYVKHRMESSDDMAFWVPEDKNRVQGFLKSKAGGMFRWAQCQLDTLELCSSSEEIDEVLKSLPKDLPATYERILARVDGKQFRSVWTVLVSLAFATNPLTLDEVINILRIDPRAKPPTKDIAIYHKKLLASCSSLVFAFSEATRDKKSGKLGSPEVHLRLAHLSVKEYLVSEETKQSSVGAFGVSHGLGNRVMAELCLGCLLQHDSVLSFGRQTLNKFPFTIYAAENWGNHAKEANNEGTGRELLDNLLFEFLHSTAPEIYVNWSRASGRCWTLRTRAGYLDLYPPWYLDPAQVRRSPKDFEFIPWPRYETEGVQPLITHSELQTEIFILMESGLELPLTFAAELNLWRMVGMLLHARRPGSYAMDEAMCRGLQSHAYDSLEVLVTLGNADVNSRNKSERTLLERCETPSAIRWLVAHGATLNPDRHFRPALHTFCSIYRWYYTAESAPTVVATLLELGADPETVFEARCDDRVWLATPLQIAAYRGNIGCVRVLLDHGAAVNRVEGRVGSSLHAAVFGGCREVFDHLLSQGADIHAVSGIYGSVLSASGCGGATDMVKACLQQGACWDDFIDANLEIVRGHQWKTLDYETQKYLITHIIQVSYERHHNLAESVRRRFLSLDGAIGLARSFGLGDEDAKALKEGQNPPPNAKNIHVQDLRVLKKYTFHGPIESNPTDHHSSSMMRGIQGGWSWPHN